MSMSSVLRPVRWPRVLSCASVLVLFAIQQGAMSQSPPAPSPAKRAIDERKAIFTLIGANFRPIGEQLQGRASLSDADARKRAERVAFLAVLSSEAFSEVSNVGDPGTRAKPEIWSRRAEFDKSVAEFVKRTQTLSQVVATQGTGSAAFKAAAGAVGESCKACHDDYRSK
jgi:cytochrome c556